LNLDQAVRQTQRIFGDDFEIQITVEDCIDWINEAQMTVARETECFTATQTANYGPTTQGVALNSDFIGEKRVTYDSVPLDRTELTSIDNLGLMPPDSTGGTPTHFYFWDNNIWIFPQPASIKTLSLYYIKSPATLTQMADQLSVPTHYHKDVVRMALIRARELNEDFGEASRLQGEVDANLGKARDDQQNRARETYPVVKDDPNDWSW